MPESPVLNILIVGDVVGKGGRNAVKSLVPELKRKHNCAFCVANIENVAGGCGVTSSCVKEMEGVVDVFTSGDHVWDQKGFEREIVSLKNFLRPANLSNLQPGRGCGVFRNPAGGEVAVVNLLGKVFMKESAYCPFETVEKCLAGLPRTVKCVIVDIHAEATSEKAAMARFLDGKATLVFGTHTHVQTADARVLQGGTAFISDVGMVGGHESVLGRDPIDVIRKFRTGMPARLPVVETGTRLDCAVVSYELETGRATALKAFSEFAPDTQDANK